jgi:4-amino-4-deoxy-L-arabinose transferase-like glycosyltransferase
MTADTTLRTQTPIWATPPGTAIIVLLLMLPRLAFAARFGLIGDEAYYAIWSFHPAFNYFDHSPSVAWVIWLGRTLFGESAFAVRSMFLAADLLVCAALYRMAVVLFGRREIGAVAAIAYSVTVGVLITFSVATPDGPSTLFWVLTIWAVAEFTGSRNANWWLLAGAFAGLGLLSKYTVVFLGAGLLFYLVTSRERLGWLKLWQVWAGGALAVLLFAPVVWINSQRDWNSFRFQLGRSNFADHLLQPGEFLRFLIETSIQLLPTLFVFVVIGIVLFFARRGRGLAVPVLTSAPMVAYFLADALFGRVNPNWTAPLFPILALIGAWAAVTVRPGSRWLRLPLDVLYVLHVPLGLAIMLCAYGIIDSRTVPFVGRVQAFDFVYGWDDLWTKVSGLARQNGAQWVDTSSYSLNGWLGYYAAIAHDPLPVFETAEPFRYEYLPPMSAALQAAPHLWITPGAGGGSANMTFLGTITRDYAGEPLDTYAVYLVK